MLPVDPAPRHHHDQHHRRPTLTEQAGNCLRALATTVRSACSNALLPQLSATFSFCSGASMEPSLSPLTLSPAIRATQQMTRTAGGRDGGTQRLTTVMLNGMNVYVLGPICTERGPVYLPHFRRQSLPGLTEGVAVCIAPHRCRARLAQPPSEGASSRSCRISQDSMATFAVRERCVFWRQVTTPSSDTTSLVT